MSSQPTPTSQFDTAMTQESCQAVADCDNVEEKVVHVHTEFKIENDSDISFMELLNSLESAREQKVQEKKRQIDELVTKKVYTKKEKREVKEPPVILSSPASPEAAGGGRARVLLPLKILRIFQIFLHLCMYQ